MSTPRFWVSFTWDREVFTDLVVSLTIRHKLTKAIEGNGCKLVLKVTELTNQIVMAWNCLID